MPHPSRPIPLARHLAHAALAALLLAPALPALAPPVSAQDAAPSIPGLGDLPEGVTLNYAVGGPIGDFSVGSQLVLERFDLAAGDAVPGSEAAQILVAESGSLTLIDDLGLQATLAEGQAFFADAGSASALLADGSAQLLRFVIELSTVQLDITDTGCPQLVNGAPGGTLAVHNLTQESTRLTIVSLGVHLTLKPSESKTITLPDDSGSWGFTCGTNASGTLVLTTSPGDLSTAEERPGQILKSALEYPIGNASLVMLSLSLDPGAAIGPFTVAGEVGIYSAESALTVLRPGKLNAALPAGRGVVLPDSTIATLVNNSDQATEVLLVAVVPETPFLGAEAGAVDEIDVGACPTEMTVVAGADVALVNSTKSSITFVIRSLDISVQVDPGQTHIFTLPARVGEWVAECGSTKSLLTILASAP